MTNTKKEPIEAPMKTGYKKVDAVIYVFDFIFDSAKKDIRVFVVTILFLMNVAGWGCFIWQVTVKDKKIKEATERCAEDFKEERLIWEHEKEILRGENAAVKNEFIKLSDDYKSYQKECNKKTESLLERLIKNGK